MYSESSGFFSSRAVNGREKKGCQQKIIENPLHDQLNEREIREMHWPLWNALLAWVLPSTRTRSFMCFKSERKSFVLALLAFQGSERSFQLKDTGKVGRGLVLLGLEFFWGGGTFGHSTISV
jgi:hypothetical protein